MAILMVELRQLSKRLVFTCEGVVFMTHIGGRPGRYAKGIGKNQVRKAQNFYLWTRTHIKNSV